MKIVFAAVSNQMFADVWFETTFADGINICECYEDNYTFPACMPFTLVQATGTSIRILCYL